LAPGGTVTGDVCIEGEAMPGQYVLIYEPLACFTCGRGIWLESLWRKGTFGAARGVMTRRRPVVRRSDLGPRRLVPFCNEFATRYDEQP
jgi:hypothetical protein